MMESFRKNKKGICLMACSSLCVCVGQLMWKLSVKGGAPFLIMGFCFYGTGALIMLYAYRFGKLSVLQPVLSLNYVISILLAVFVLREEITLIKILGVLAVIVGVVLIAGGDQ